MTLRTIILVPAFNEGQSLRGVIRDLRDDYPGADVIVINDGSTDDTAAVAREESVLTLNIPFNMGIGVAVQTGLLYAARNRYDAAVQFDGDGQHRADRASVAVRTTLSEQMPPRQRGTSPHPGRMP